MVLEYEIIYSEITGIQFSGIVLKEGIWCVAKGCLWDKHVFAGDLSITTAGVQKLYLGRDDADLIRGKRIVLMDDVISTGGSLHAMEELVKMAGGTVVDRIAVLAEGGAADRKDIKYLNVLPVFNADGSIK